MKIDDLRATFTKLYKSNLSISDLTTMEKQLSLEKDTVTLTPLFQCASKLFAVIVEQGDSVPLNNLYNLYVVKMGNPLNTAAFGHSSVTSLLNALPEVFEVSGKANKRLVSIHQFLQGTTLFFSATRSSQSNSHFVYIRFQEKFEHS
jgi:OST-HTH/LOTUS domain